MRDDREARRQRAGARTFTELVNAAGSYTPLGVSRSSPAVAEASSAALQRFVVVDELHDAVAGNACSLFGAPAATVVHCAAAGITLAAAAVMTGDDGERIARLPRSDGFANRIVIATGHAVDYGHPVVTDLRLAGAEPVPVGDDTRCEAAALEAALAADGVAGLLWVSSRLVRGTAPTLAEAVAIAHRHGRPVVVDGAAQDLRADELLASGADLVVLSAQKYLAAPTAGLVLGRADLVRAVRAQQRGIGRAMKPSKEALAGLLVALDERARLDRGAWADAQAAKVERLLTALAGLPAVAASAVPDPAGMPFARVAVDVRPPARAADWAAALAAGTPSIRVMTHGLATGRLWLELVPLDEAECRLVAEAITRLAKSA